MELFFTKIKKRTSYCKLIEHLKSSKKIEFPTMKSETPPISQPDSLGLRVPTATEKKKQL